MLGGERIPVSGRVRGDAPDVEHESLSVEVKSRKSVPAWLRDALEQADAASRDGKLPVCVVHEEGKPYKESIVVMNLGEFASYHKERRWT